MGPGDPWNKAGRCPGPDLANWLTLGEGPRVNIYKTCGRRLGRQLSPFTLLRSCQPVRAQGPFLGPKAGPIHLSLPFHQSLLLSRSILHVSTVDVIWTLSFLGKHSRAVSPQGGGREGQRPQSVLPVSSLSYRVPSPTCSPSMSHDFSIS